jgi:hypothetical protein
VLELSDATVQSGTYLRVFLNGSSRLISDTRLVHLRSNHVYQIKCVVNARGSEALNLFSFAAILAGALCRLGGSNFWGIPSGDSTGARGL